MEESEPVKFCVFDVEGDVGKLGWQGMAIYSDRHQSYTTDQQEAHDLLLWHAEDAYTLAAHNAEYDVTVGLWPMGIPARIVYKNDRFNHAFWLYDPKEKRCEIWDSLQLAGGLSIAKLGQALGLPKLTTPQRLLGQEPDKYTWKCEVHDAWECETCYAIRDAEIAFRYLESYARLMEGYGTVAKRTMGSAAMAVWRSVSAPARIDIRDRRASGIARDSYRGGRVEAFGLGHYAGIHTADVRSMYPSIMRSLPLPAPIGLTAITGRHINADVLQWEGAAEVTVSAPEVEVPVLPYYDGERVLFPVGRFRATFTHLELRAALQRGYVVQQIHRTVFSKHTVTPFVDYVDGLTALRDMFRREHDPREQVAKILLNSLYGRLGLRERMIEERIGPILPGERVEEIPGLQSAWIDGSLMVRINPWWGTKAGIAAKLSLSAVPDDEQGSALPNKYANVLWASYITAGARLRLLEALEANTQGLVYCDTDSVFSTQPIIGLSEGLGGLEDTGYWDRAWIVGPKLYRLERDDGTSVAKAKGVPRSVADRYLRGERVEIIQPNRPKSSLNSGKTIGLWSPQYKQLRSRPGKRHVLHPDWIGPDDGHSSTSPLVLALSPDSESD